MEQVSGSKSCSMTFRKRQDYEDEFKVNELMFAVGLAEGVPSGKLHCLKKHQQYELTHGQFKLPLTLTIYVNRSGGAGGVLLTIWDEHHQLQKMSKYTMYLSSKHPLYPVVLPGRGVAVWIH